MNKKTLLLKLIRCSEDTKDRSKMSREPMCSVYLGGHRAYNQAIKFAKELPEDDGPSRKFVLVYQAGIANVFSVLAFTVKDEGRDAKRIYQGDFHTAEAQLHGMWLAGAKLGVAACNRAGDIAKAEWDTDIDEMPFRDGARPPVAYADILAI